MAYVTKQQVKNYLGITWTAELDSFIDTLISSAEKFIEEFCGDSRFGKRSFEAPSPDEAVVKYFNGNGRERLYIGDVRSISSLVVDGVTLVENTDFYTYPLNAVAEEKPIIAIELVQPETSTANANPRQGSTIPYIFEELQRSVVATGKWGYSAVVPNDITLATMKLVGGIIKENIGDSDLKEVTQESLGEYSTTYAKVKDIAHSVGIPAILTPYKRKKNGDQKIIQVS